MKTIFEICIFIVLVGIPLQLFYWSVIRPVLLAKIESESFKLRKRLELAGEITSREGKQALPVIERKCHNLSHCLNDVDAFLSLIAKIPVETKLRIERDKEIIALAPPDLRTINNEIELMFAGAAFVNSPGLIVACVLFLPLVLVVALCCVATNKVRSAWETIARHLRVGLYLPSRAVAC